ncbi:PD-(D/E)XK nuclease family protein [Actinomadura parmotrematis]|uniref:PD-(D/E)XK nuclease family protein n=1 Tax=Actinomadura parmotrematis TaxID=2864039 RepID=A0ABS7FZ36_9ACTN|nr:PD-(D/E)XK nuclease family protein [Actinomadura parmotrematis]MBW8485566.1 PD-(D/E)XK nuclease family protein [Actinomadura parmotrematis]
MPALSLPPDVGGDPTLVRVSASMLGQDDRACPRGSVLRARPLLRWPRGRSPRAPFEDFTLQPVMRALDLIEDGVFMDAAGALADPRVTGRCHPGHLAWAAEAVPAFLRAREAVGLPGLLPVRDEWVVVNTNPLDARGAERYERTAWGRRYASPDGTVREVWLPAFTAVRDDLPPAKIAAVATVAARGVASERRYGRYEPVGGPRPPVERVRVVAFGCTEGRAEVLADWDSGEVARRFAAEVRPALAGLLAGEALAPGSDCVSCKALPGCEGPAPRPGLLAVAGAAPSSVPPARRRRSVSATDLRVHAQCGARFWLTRVLHLKDIAPESEAIRRGRAVDEELNRRHAAGRGPCRDAFGAGGDVPDGDAPDGAVARMLARHRDVCPLDGLAPGERVRVQPRLTAYDADLDAVVIADPDLLYSDAGGWVWRETKTAGRPLWEGRSLLEQYPQLALAVVLMAAGVPGGDPRRSRVELEVLYENDAACEIIDPFDERTRDEARDVVGRLTAGWASDTAFAPEPGRHCAGCETLRWCPSGQAARAGAEAGA